jgi:hypothetical protein
VSADFDTDASWHWVTSLLTAKSMNAKEPQVKHYKESLFPMALCLRRLRIKRGISILINWNEAGGGGGGKGFGWF